MIARSFLKSWLNNSKKSLVVSVSALGLASLLWTPPVLAEEKQNSLFDFSLEDSNGTLDLSQYRDKVCLIVNTASNSKLAEPNYIQLQHLYEKYEKDGSEKLANGEIAEHAAKKYGVTFPFVNRIDSLNGETREDIHPFIYFLRRQLPGKRWYGSWNIPWNWSKFLFDHNGNPYKRYDLSVCTFLQHAFSHTKTFPLEFEEDIKILLKQRSDDLKS